MNRREHPLQAHTTPEAANDNTAFEVLPENDAASLALAAERQPNSVKGQITADLLQAATAVHLNDSNPDAGKNALTEAANNTNGFAQAA